MFLSSTTYSICNNIVEVVFYEESFKKMFKMYPLEYSSLGLARLHFIFLEQEQVNFASGKENEEKKNFSGAVGKKVMAMFRITEMSFLSLLPTSLYQRQLTYLPFSLEHYPVVQKVVMRHATC